MKRDSLGDRMKRYENVNRNYLTRRTPVIIRIDGRAFHTFTKGFRKPFDGILTDVMQNTMKYLCENIQGCVLGYTQSDEISLLLIDYQTLESSAWFDYNIQKLASISASMATMQFNRLFIKSVVKWKENCQTAEDERYLVAMERAVDKGATFDARCFNIPKEDVTNYFIWRQNDATRNSIEMVGHCNFSQKELHKKTCNEIQDMLFVQRAINWNDYPATYKRGSCCIRVTENETGRTPWKIDTNIPIFKEAESRHYVEELIL